MNKFPFSLEQCITLFEGFRFGVLVLDDRGKAVWSNPAFMLMTGYDHNSLAAMSKDALTASGLAALATETPVLELSLSPGKTLSLRCEYHLLHAGNGRMLHVHFYHDLHAEQTVREQIKIMQPAGMDSLLRNPVTGLLEFPVFRLMVEPQIARCRRYHDKLSVVVMEISYADGNNKLDAHAEHHRLVTRQLNEVTRWSDLISMHPDGYFVMVLPETGPDEITPLAGKIEERLNNYSWFRKASFGATEWKKPDNFNSFIKRALLALESANIGAEGVALL